MNLQAAEGRQLRQYPKDIVRENVTNDGDLNKSAGT